MASDKNALEDTSRRNNSMGQFQGIAQIKVKINDNEPWESGDNCYTNEQHSEVVTFY